MESVPETERLDEFKPSRLPTLRLVEAAHQSAPDKDDEKTVENCKPSFIRRVTDPYPSSPQSPGWPSPTLPYHNRNSSPYARGHSRPSPSTGALSALPMSRAQSLPGVNAAGHLYLTPQRSSSPRGSPPRSRRLRKPVDEVFPTSPKRYTVFSSESVSTISENDEEPSEERRCDSPSTLAPHHTFPRVRRPSSPLRSGPSSLTSSPLMSRQSSESSLVDYYSYPRSYASSSVPSTPNSLRSRSPSISSLETIPDSPDAEEAAVEAERIAQLKAAADAADGDEAAQDLKRTATLDSSSRGRTLGISFSSRDKRKRWSVCGAERRQDLNLDTIWED